MFYKFVSNESELSTENGICSISTELTELNKFINCKDLNDDLQKVLKK